jgi:bacteriocin biosynthesis cyclodehydratase domain-containing protein
MVLRLDPSLPLLWRTPSSLQVGSDEPLVVLDDVSDGEDRLLAALSVGVSPTGYAMLARSLGVASEVADRLLSRLEAALVDETGSASPTAAVLGDSPLARTVAALLGACGALGSVDDSVVVVLVADWVLAPVDHLSWLNRDVPHLPVVVAERTVTVGPLVEPGDGPCLHCVHLARLDDDPSWGAVATQLLGREGRVLGDLERAEAAAFVVRRVLERLAGARRAGMSWRLDGAGSISAREWGRHPDCRCAAPPGTDWAAAPDPAVRGAPTTASAVGVPA